MRESKWKLLSNVKKSFRINILLTSDLAFTRTIVAGAENLGTRRLWSLSKWSQIMKSHPAPTKVGKGESASLLSFPQTDHSNQAGANQRHEMKQR